MRNLFGRYTYTWWQLGLLKLSLLIVGLVIGAAASDWVLANMGWLAVVWIPPVAYLIWLSLKPGTPTDPTGKNVSRETSHNS